MKPPAIKLPDIDVSMPASPSTKSGSLRGRGRSASIVKVEEVGDRSKDEALDRSAYVNPNVTWVDSKGAWLIHIVLICIGKIIIDTMPGMTQEISWTLVNLLYQTICYIMFHGVTGVPFENDLHGGAYDDLTLWEQIDDGAQYTPARKWLLSVPIVLFLMSTHYTNYNPWTFAINITAVIVLVIIPKLPQLHRQRVRFMKGEDSGIATPITPSFPPSGFATPNATSKLGPGDITDAHFFAKR